MEGLNLKEKILKYIDYMRGKHGIIAAMVTGSFVTGDMGPRSDIDIFFIWTEAYQSMRGREYFEGLEFEYFISPEWKYYDRLRTDKISMRIYSTSMIVVDPQNKLENIKNTAIRKIEEYKSNINTDMKRDYKFWLETICSDGEDLFDKGDYSNFLFFTGYNLNKMNDLLCELNNKLPTYHKYGVKEINEIDKIYGQKLEEFLVVGHCDPKKKQLWYLLCNYLQGELGDHDISNYESYQTLE